MTMYVCRAFSKKVAAVENEYLVKAVPVVFNKEYGGTEG